MRAGFIQSMDFRTDKNWIYCDADRHKAQNDDLERIERHHQGKGCTSFAGWIMALVYREIGDAAAVQDGHQDGGAAGDHRDAGTNKEPLEGQIDIFTRERK